METRMKDELAVCAAKADVSPGPLPELVHLKIFSSPWWPISVTLLRIIANSSREIRWPSLGLQASVFSTESLVIPAGSGNPGVLQMSNNGYKANLGWLLASVIGLVLPSAGAVSPATV